MTTETVWDVVHRVAREDDRIVFVGSDLNPTLLTEMRDELPEQFFMEGIQEQHVIGMASGMAIEGALPVVSTIATFLTRRCFEQILIDAGMHGLPLMLLGTGPGVAYHFFGPTHCAVDDIALLRAVPGMTIIAPGSMAEAAELFEAAVRAERLAYLRVPRFDQTPSPFDGAATLDEARVVRRGDRVVIISTGALTAQALEAAESLDPDVRVGVVHVATVKPLDVATILREVSTAEVVVTVEEHLRDGGLGSAVLEALSDALGADSPRVIRCGLPGRYVEGYGTWADAIEIAGLDSAGIIASIRRALGEGE